VTGPRRSRRAGGALVHVLVAAAVIAVAAVAWRSAFAAFHDLSVRSVDRARARAVARAGWERARVALRRGQPAACGPEALLAGEVTVAVASAPARGPDARTVTVTGRVGRAAGGAPLAYRLVVVVAGAGPDLRVVDRREAAR